MLYDDHTSYHLEVWYWTKSARLIVWLWHHPFEFTQKAGMLLRGGGSGGMYLSLSFVATPPPQKKKTDCYQHNQEDVETKLVLTREQHQMYLICFAICVPVVAKKKGLSSNVDVLLIVFRLEWWNMLYKVAVIWFSFKEYYILACIITYNSYLSLSSVSVYTPPKASYMSRGHIGKLWLFMRHVRFVRGL